MKKYDIFFMVFTILCFSLISPAHASPPVLFFSDLDSGPATGNGDTSKGQKPNEHGAIVTIWGKNFGPERGGCLTIGGRPAPHIYYWGTAKVPNKAGESCKSLADSHEMEMISFQVHKDADNTGISLQTSEGFSNILEFTVRAGSIYFVDGNAAGPGSGTFSDPWKSPADYISRLATDENGAICYFRKGVYANTEYGESRPINKSLFYVNSNIAGLEGHPNAFVGYPEADGGAASFEATAGGSASDPDYFMYVFHDYPYNSMQHLTISNLRMQSNTVVAEVRGNWRFVGNLCIGGSIYNGGSGILLTGVHTSDEASRPENQYICGNVITGERSENKLNHGVYFGISKDCDFGYNYLYDNSFKEGPVLSCNTDGSREKGYLAVENLNIHHSVIDMTHFPSRAVGVHLTSAGSSVNIFNNIIIGPVYGNNPAIYARSAAIRIYNNTLYNTGGDYSVGSISFLNYQAYYPEGISIRNNLICSHPQAASYIDVPDTAHMPAPVISNNCYYGIGPYAHNATGQAVGADSTPIEQDPKLMDAEKDNFRPNADSPLIHRGINLSLGDDFDGNPRTATPSIGAHEYNPEYGHPIGPMVVNPPGTITVE